MTAEEHRTEIAALETELSGLRGKIDHSAFGRSFNYGNRRKEIRDEIEWHQQQILNLEGGFEIETQGY